MLISGVLPIMSLYRLPHGQYAYSGHVINLPQDVASFASCRPGRPGRPSRARIDRRVMSCQGVTRSGSPHNALHFTSYTYRENVALKSQVWGSLTLAQLSIVRTSCHNSM